MQVQDKYIIRNLEMEKCKMVILLSQKFSSKIKDTMEKVEKEMESPTSSSLLLGFGEGSIKCEIIMRYVTAVTTRNTPRLKKLQYNHLT